MPPRRKHVMTSGPAAPRVSVVIVNWNARPTLAACLASLDALGRERPDEVIVVDNASTDGSVVMIRAEAPGVRVIANADNRGLAAANNQGLVAATGDFIVISNPDVVYQPGSLDELRACLGRHPRAAFAIAQLTHPDGRIQTSAGDLPRFGEALLGRQATRAQGKRSGFWWDAWDHANECEVGHGTEACYMVRRVALAEIGPQDEGFFLDWEGLDWSARARAAGWEIWFCPTARVVHLGGHSIGQSPWRWIRASHTGMYRYYAKRSSPLARPALAAAVSTRAALKAAAMRAGVGMYKRAHDG